jgi:phage I-like protein
MAHDQPNGTRTATSLANDAPAERRKRNRPTRDTTLRQIGERIGKSQSMVADGQAEIAVLTALQTEMTSAHVPSVAGLSADVRARHREAIRLASGLNEGVELW